MKQKIFYLLMLVAILFLVFFVVKKYQANIEFKNNLTCAQQKDSAANRIKTYYTSGDIESIYPDSIFYSKKEKRCIAIWSFNEISSNGMATRRVIFDPVTNEELISISTFSPTDKKIKDSLLGYNIEKEKRFNQILDQVKN